MELYYKIFDAHCDTMGVLLEKGDTLQKSNTMIKSEHLRQYDGYVQVFAAWVDSNAPLKKALQIADKFYIETKKNGFTVIENAETLQSVIERGGVGAILSLEDGVALCGSLGVLRMLYRMGFRLITLTWNGKNELGEGAVGSEGGGLTAFGKEAVKEMQSLGMVVDVSHLSERGFWDVLEIAKKPIVASHSNASALCKHPRNLSDAQIRALIQRGGVVGLNFFVEFLREDGKASLTDVLRQTEHILALGGENNVGIGSDFDGIHTAPEGLENAGKIYTLLDAMAKIGYKEDLIEKIAYKNFLRVFAICL